MDLSNTKNVISSSPSLWSQAQCQQTFSIFLCCFLYFYNFALMFLYLCMFLFCVFFIDSVEVPPQNSSCDHLHIHDAREQSRRKSFSEYEHTPEDHIILPLVFLDLSRFCSVNRSLSPAVSKRTQRMKMEVHQLQLCIMHVLIFLCMCVNTVYLPQFIIQSSAQA